MYNINMNTNIPPPSGERGEPEVTPRLVKYVRDGQVLVEVPYGELSSREREDLPVLHKGQMSVDPHGDIIIDCRDQIAEAIGSPPMGE